MHDSDEPAALPTPLPPAGDGALGPVWDALADRAVHYATRARGDGTRRT